MSFVTAQPDLLDAAAGHLAGVSSVIAARNTAAALPTTGVIPAAADQVSMLTAAQFASYGHLYQSISSQATAMLEAFVSTLQGSAGTYAATEAANSVLAG